MTEIHHLEILEPLGRGPRGESFLAIHPDIEGDLVYKVLSDELFSGKKARSRFIEDYQVLLHNEEISDSPTVHGVGERNGRIYVLRDHVRGIPLSMPFFHLVSFQISNLFEMTLQACAYMRGLHRLGLFHGGLHLENVILRPNGSLAFTDPAQPLPPSVGSEKGGILAELTGFLAPEQLEENREVDERVDLYSWGIVLYHLGMLERPFPGRTGTEVREEVLYGSLASLEEETSVDSRLRLLMARLMVRDPSGRPQTAASVEREIQVLPEGACHRMTPEVFHALAIRCGLEDAFPAPEGIGSRAFVVDSSWNPPPERQPPSISPKAEIEVEETQPRDTPVQPEEPIAPPPGTTPPLTRTEPPIPSPVAPPASSPPPVKTLPSMGAERVPKPEPGPVELIKRYIEAWNRKAFLAEYHCFAPEFIHSGRDDYVDRRMKTYLNVTNGGRIPVTQELAQMLRVEKVENRARILCARKLVFPRKQEIFLDLYTLGKSDAGWRITAVRSKRATEDDLRRVTDHELGFLASEPLS